MATVERSPQRLGPLPADVPPLENGDRLTRAEFERIYHLHPEIKKAECIEGRVYVPSPVRFRVHGHQHSHIVTLFGVYEAHTPGVMTADNTTVRLDLDNEPQPDCCLRIVEAAGGKSAVDDDDYLVNGPEVVAEVAASSASYDLHDKLHVYRRNAVQEYFVWRVLDAVVECLVLTDEGYVGAIPDDAGVLRSQVLPGLWIDAPALVRGDLRAALETLQRGLATAEHAAFVEKLQLAVAAAGKNPSSKPDPS